MTTMMTDPNPTELTLTRPQPRAATAPAHRPAHQPAPRPRAGQPVGRTSSAVADERSEELIEVLQSAAASLSVAIIEIFGGTRAPSSVGKWVVPDLFERIRAHAAYRQKLAQAAPPRPPMLSAGTPRVCLVSPRVAEAAVVVNTGRRHRAVALRLEHIRNRWLLTQLETC